MNPYIDINYELLSQRLTNILEGMPEGFCALDHGENITYVNRTAERIFGADRSELLGRNLWDVFPDAVDSEFYEQYRRALRDQVLVEFVAFYPPLDLWAEIRAVPTPDGLSIFFRNVNNRVRAEEALRLNQEMLETLLRNFPNGSVNVFDRDLRYRFVDGQGLARVGLTPAYLLGKRLADLYKPEDVARVAPYYESAFAGEEVTFELSIMGNTYEVHAAPLHNAKGEIESIIVVALDITSRKKAEMAVRESEERFRALTEFSSDLITVINAEGQIHYISHSANQILGMPPEELIGTDCFQLIHPDDLAEMRRLFDDLLHRHQRNEGVTCRCRRSDGSWCYLESVATNQLENPAIRGIVTHSRDVSERIRLQAQVLRTEKLAALGELVAGVAHEINNPLTAISGYAQLLQMHDDPTVRDDAKTIDTMVNRATRIVRSLRSYAVSSENKKRTANLNEIVNASLEIVAYKLRKADVTVNLKLADELPAIHVNVGEIEQVLVSLLSNAEYALRGKPASDRQVTIETRYSEPQGSSPSPQCLLTVQDNGCGMSPSVRERIFDPFFTTKDIGEGTGLGLYVTHGIIVAHEGRIEVDSQEGGGALFTVSLPIASDNQTVMEKE